MKPVWIVLLCLLGAAVLTALLVWYFEQRMLARSLGRVPDRADAQAAWEQHMLRKQGWTADSEPGSAALARARAGLAAIRERPHEDVFTPGLDGARLHARLYRVPNAHATVILCHGYHSRAEHDFGAQFPALYASGGCNLLLIDERAHGLSEGKCLTFGQLERYDIAQWVHWVREHSRVQRPIALYGVSMGAASVLLAVFVHPASYWALIPTGLLFAAVYAASMWLFGMNRYERSLITGPLRRIAGRLGR